MGKARIGGPHLLQGARQVSTAILRLDASQASEGVCEICNMTDQGQKAHTSRGDITRHKAKLQFYRQGCDVCNMTDQGQNAKTSRGDIIRQTCHSTGKGLEDYVTQQLLL